jgi:hypothetical protein
MTTNNMTREQVASIVDCVFDMMIERIQHQLNVTTGDVAAQHFTGDALERLNKLQSKVADEMMAYVKVESMYDAHDYVDAPTE